MIAIVFGPLLHARAGPDFVPKVVWTTLMIAMGKQLEPLLHHHGLLPQLLPHRAMVHNVLLLHHHILLHRFCVSGLGKSDLVASSCQMEPKQHQKKMRA